MLQLSDRNGKQQMEQKLFEYIFFDHLQCVSVDIALRPNIVIKLIIQNKQNTFNKKKNVAYI